MILATVTITLVVLGIIIFIISRLDKQ